MALNLNDGTNPPEPQGNPEQRKAQFQEDNRLLREKLARIEAGADATPSVEGAQRTAGQLWHRLLTGDEGTRMALLEGMLASQQYALDCLSKDHDRRIEHLSDELMDVQAKLSSALGFETPQPLHSLTVAVRALRSVMVDGLGARPAVKFATVDLVTEFADSMPDEQPDAKQVVADAIERAGIDTNAYCNFEWGTGNDCTNDRGEGHLCGEVNPLHVDVHVCGTCEATLTHEQAERMANQ